jgi:hypothetical protein
MTMKHLKPAPLWKAMASLAMAAILVATTSAHAGVKQPPGPPDGKYPSIKKLVKDIGMALGSSLASMAADTAIDFALKLLDISGPSDVDLAKEEIISAINDAEADEVIGDIAGSLTSLSQIMQDPANQMANNPLLGHITNNTNNAIEQIRRIADRGNAELSYSLAPYLSVAVAVGAAAAKLNSRPPSVIAGIYQNMIDIGMTLVGVEVTYPQSKAFLNTSTTTLLWSQADLGGTRYGEPDPGGNHVCTSPAARDEARGRASSCRVRSQLCFIEGAIKPAVLPACWEETYRAALREFNNDDAVHLVKIGMLQAYAMGLNPPGLERPYIISRCLSAATRPQVDYDGDCKADIAVRSIDVGWWIRPSNGTPYVQYFGNPDDNAVLGDFDGDQKTDVALYRPSDSTWWVQPSNGTAIFGKKWGRVGDLPMAGDYDGDGISDLAVWRPSNGFWFVWPSGGADQFQVPFGLPGDVPVPGDYDGDGITDMAVWRPSSGYWLVRLSTSLATFRRQWGVAGDIPVPADYDGDGRIDLAVFRPSDLKRYVLPSNGGASYAQVSGSSATDVPIVGDFDGDYKGDVISWAPSTAVWSGQLTATGGQLNQDWGGMFGPEGTSPLGARGAPAAK